MTERSLVLLNEMGDVEISWDSTNDDAMREVIQKKMNEGIKFFIYVPTFFGLRRKKRLTTLEDLNTHSVSVKDDDIEKLWKNGQVAFSRREGSLKDYQVSRCNDAATVARSHSVGIRQFAGG